MPFEIAVVVSKYNTEITSRMLESVLKTLKNAEGIQTGTVVWVPGAFEIPAAAKMIATRQPQPDAIVCLGAIIQGKTDQNAYIANSCTIALQQIQIETGVPISYGIISADTLATAWERTEGPLDRGREAALAAIEMAQLKRKYGRQEHKDLKITPESLSKSFSHS
ncbi:MAG: 6,7-dimethyl-8-ribityllumazine synthase [Elusimicrobia bacterium]|nr:6,7-dimethyl-8-ribityllumazine synthase [Elusimicrobiota bacterium]